MRYPLRYFSCGIVALALTSCDGSSTTPNDDGGTVAVDSAVLPPPPAIRLIVDADRNGTLETDGNSADFLHRDEWGTSFGAILIANVDDDDADHKVDATDLIVNGASDGEDLSLIALPAWTEAPAEARAVLSVDAASASLVRVFRHQTDGSWALWDFNQSVLTQADLAAGAEWGIESTDFPSATWSGQVALTITVNQADQVLGSDTVRLQVAPFLLHSNLSPALRFYAMSWNGDPDSTPFINALQSGADALGIELTKIPGNHSQYGGDPWTQDLFEVGWTAMPGPSGVRGMPTVLRTPVPDRDAADYSQKVMLAPDFGWVWKHSQPYSASGAWDESLDSFGNLDSLPPYQNGDRSFPLGRVLIGSVPSRHPDPKLIEFLEAQKVQAPVYKLDTSFLIVGHVDEVTSFVQAPTPRGWKLLLASPISARTLLQGLHDAGHGSVKMFVGMKWWDDTSAETTIDQVLNSTKLQQSNQTVQAKMDTIRETLQAELGLADDEIVDIPVLFTYDNYYGDDYFVGYTPDAINLLHANGRVFPAAAHGPAIPGGPSDAFQADFENRVAPLGLAVTWTEDWNIYHAGDGEVHCGTNANRLWPTDQFWWEVAR